MLVQAMDNFQVAKRKHKENVKGQYLDKVGANGAKEYFRASELGSGDRKIIYGFFAHQLPKQEKSARNLRQLENGDYVHDRYQQAWEEMGCLLSMEQRLSSKDDEYLSQFPWEWAGHYDGELDINIIRAHALGYATVHSVFNEETGKWEIEVEIDEAYANSIGLFDENGNLSESYEPLRMVADIKTMNPWGFKRIKEQGDISDIQGYIDQISFYMYMLNTPYGSIYIENKENNDVVEVQIVWKDFHDGVEYKFDPNIHGEQTEDQVRVVIDSGRFFGDATREGVVPRLTRLWNVREALREAQERGDLEAVRQIFREHLPRCADKPNAFPCSWGHKTGKVQYCEFFQHCWDDRHQGMAVATYEPCPPEAIWEFADEQDNVVRIDSRKVPQGVTEEGFLALVEAGVLDYTKFLVDEDMAAYSSEEVASSEETATHADNLFTKDGELKLDAPAQPSETEEYINEDGKKAIKCTNCKKEVTYQRLGNGGTKKCDFCGHVNHVIKL